MSHCINAIRQMCYTPLKVPPPAHDYHFFKVLMWLHTYSSHLYSGAWDIWGTVATGTFLDWPILNWSMLVLGTKELMAQTQDLRSSVWPGLPPMLPPQPNVEWEAQEDRRLCFNNPCFQINRIGQYFRLQNMCQLWIWTTVFWHDNSTIYHWAVDSPAGC